MSYKNFNTFDEALAATSLSSRNPSVPSRQSLVFLRPAKLDLCQHGIRCLGLYISAIHVPALVRSWGFRPVISGSLGPLRLGEQEAEELSTWSSHSASSWQSTCFPQNQGIS